MSIFKRELNRVLTETDESIEPALDYYMDDPTDERLQELAEQLARRCKEYHEKNYIKYDTLVTQLESLHETDGLDDNSQWILRCLCKALQKLTNWNGHLCRILLNTAKLDYTFKPAEYINSNPNTELQQFIKTTKQSNVFYRNQTLYIDELLSHAAEEIRNNDIITAQLPDLIAEFTKLKDYYLYICKAIEHHVFQTRKRRPQPR